MLDSYYILLHKRCIAFEYYICEKIDKNYNHCIIGIYVDDCVDRRGVFSDNFA